MDRTRVRHVDDAIDSQDPAFFRFTETNPFTGQITHSFRGERSRPASARGSLPRGYQVTGDENHSAQLSAFHSGKFEGDIGGEFDMVRKSTICDNRMVTLHDAYTELGFDYVIDYHGPVFPLPYSSMSYPPTPSYVNLAPIGTKAIALCKPTNNVANLATDLVETKSEGLPHLYGVNLWKDRTNIARGAGSEYLNSEFGWKPLASDIRGASYAAANAHTILKSYEANSHKMVRRRYEFPVERTETNSLVGSSVPDIPDFGTYPPGFLSRFLHTGNLFLTTRTYRKLWFSGAFTYHLPVGYKSHNALVSAAAKAKPLLGIGLTPDTVWNLTPWSWALDWVSNMGDVISNTSDMITDGLVIKYGYVMEHSVTSYTYTHVTGNRYTSPIGSHSFDYTPSQLTSYVERKRRTKATPFGFETSWGNFTPRQLAIAAALGLTRIF